MTDEGFMTQAIMAQAMGGPRSGTALLSLWQQMAGGTMRARTAKGLEEFGLLSPKEWQSDKGGGVILNNDASKRLTGLIGKDPLDFAAKLVENLKARGINDQEEQMRMVMRALGRQTTQRYSAEMVNNFHQMLAERERMAGGMGAGNSFGLLMNKSVGANIEGLKNAWDNLLMAVAGPQSERVIKILQSLTGMLNSMQMSVGAVDPKTITAIAEGIGVLGLALTGGGAVAIMAALGPAGWIAMAAIAVGGLIALDWEAVSRGFNKVRDAISSFIGWIKSFLVPNAPTAPDIDPKGETFKKELEKAAPSYVPMRFDPGTGGPKHQQFAFALNVDGERLAQTIIDKMDGKYRYDTNTPAFNGAGSYGA